MNSLLLSIPILSMVAMGSLLGTAIRWWGGPSWTWILLINVLGSLIAGLVSGWPLPSAVSTAILIGFCGSLTTFSGFALLMIQQLQQGEFFKVGLIFFANNALCLMLCYVGWKLSHNYFS